MVQVNTPLERVARVAEVKVSASTHQTNLPSLAQSTQEVAVVVHMRRRPTWLVVQA